MNENECPMGEQCSIHFRVNEDNLDNPEYFDRLVTYVGEYAVVTDENQDPLRMLFGPRYDTMVFRVGSGTLNDLKESILKGDESSLVLDQSHDEKGALRDHHGMVVDWVKEGVIA